MGNDRRKRKKRFFGHKDHTPEQQTDIVPPKPFVRKRLIVRLLTVVAVALAVAVGTSVFFKVDTILVAGAEKYTERAVVDAAGISVGQSLLFFGKGEAAANIKSQLPYVGNVRFEIRLPGTVQIVIEEKTVAYALEATDGTWWKITSDGVVVEKGEGTLSAVPSIEGVLLKDPAVGESAVADDTRQEGTATAAERLNAAVEILRQLERNALFAQVTHIDVSDLYAINLSCGERYRVELGDMTGIETKMQLIRSALANDDLPDSGVLTLYYEDELWKVLYNPWA